jgi:hypothetical protein
MTGLAAADTPDARVFWFTTGAQRAQIGELIVGATEAFIADADQSRTDFGWFRQSWDEIQTDSTASCVRPSARSRGRQCRFCRRSPLPTRVLLRR